MQPIRMFTQKVETHCDWPKLSSRMATTNDGTFNK